MSKESAMTLATSAVTEAVPTEVTTPPSTTPVDEPAKLDSDRFAAVARQEARIVKERLELKKQLAEAQELKSKLQDPYDKIQRFEQLRAKDPIAAMKEIGFTETDIFNFMANKEEPKEPSAAEIAAKVATDELNKYKLEQKKLAEEAQFAQDKAAIDRYKKGVAEQIEREKDKYEYTAFYGAEAQDLIFDTIKELVTKGVKWDLKSVLDDVEWYYEEEDKAKNVLKKRQSNGQPTAQPSGQEPLKAEVKPGLNAPVRTRSVTSAQDIVTPAPKTLTNKIAPTATATMATRNETREQKRARLIEALRTGAKI